jgi:hypothetical protein
VLNGSVEIKANTAPFAPTATSLWWTTSPLWTLGMKNTTQLYRLYDCEGTLVSSWTDAQ